VSRVPRPPLVRHTSGVIAATGGAVAIGDLRVAAGGSSTHLTQRFKEVIGVTPKRLARAHRFTATVFAIDPAGPIDWSGLAGRAGYFDQAHLGHEFRAFTGLTPTRYVEVAAGDVGGQALAAGLVDEVRMDVVPVVLGSGKRFFGPVHTPHLLEDPDEVLQGDRVLHVRYRVRR
jgi:AraC-like DNA-binding protein